MNPDIKPDPAAAPIHGAQPPPVLAPASSPATPRPPVTFELEPLGRPATLATVIEALLKQPGRVLHECRGEGGGKVRGILIVAALLCLAVFGVLLGMFSGGVQYAAAPGKVVLGMAVSVVICLPSFYIFSALGGVEGRFSHMAGVLLASVAVTAVLLLGFAPVLWIFSQSTESVAFMGFLALVFWLISLLFGFRLLFAAAGCLGMTGRHYLVVWMGIFLVVTLQMSTALRPIIGTAPTLLPTQKKFFLEHWLYEMGMEQQREPRGETR